jgi:NADP-dependent 3-hydroxy acid dehydrogenase YdfG
VTPERVLLITGASSGIGASTARHAVEAGWRVVLAARSQERLDALAQELGGPEHALAVRCDVSEWEQQQRMVERALAAFGRVDAAFANAGFGGPRGFLMYSCTKHAVTAMGEAARQDLDGTGIRVTLIEPGMVDTPFFDKRPTQALEDQDIARAVIYAISQPPHVNVNEILIRPTAQQG